jgi:hypothetical protein
MRRIKWAGLFCFLWAVFSGCPPQRIVGRPAWVANHQHDKYRSESYLIGTGEGSTREKAAQAAREDLISQLKIHLGLILQEKKQSVAKDSWFNPYHFSPGNLAEIAKSEIVHTWNSKDGSRHAALAALDRSRLAKTSFEKVLAAQKSCKDSVAKGDLQLKDERHPYQALLLYTQALLDFTQAEKLGILLQAATGKSLSDPTAPTAKNLVDKIDRLLDGVELRSVRGDGQRVDDQGALSSPLVTGAYMTDGTDRFPVKGLPLRFRLQRGESVDIRGSTNEFGAFTARLEKVPADPKKTSLVIARIDGEQVFSDAGLKPDDPRFSTLLQRIKIFETSFRLLAPNEAATRILVLVWEDISGTQLPSSVVLEQFSRTLAREGFDLVDPGTLEEPLEATLPLDKAIAATKGKTDILVLGSVEAGVSQVVTAQFVFAKAKGKIQAISTESGKVLATFEQEVKGAGSDAQSADKRALTTFARKAIRTLLDAILKPAGKPS